MSIDIATYAGLKRAVLDWLGQPANMLLNSRFDDFLLNCEQRMYYGHATEDPGNPLRSDPLRIAEMETVDPIFPLAGSYPDLPGVRLTDLDDVRVVEEATDLDLLPPATVPQPDGFLELISATLNSPATPLQIVSQRTLDGYGTQNLGSTKLIAVSGMNFRVKEAPADGTTATLRYYQRLPTPTDAAPNSILTAYPSVYLNGCTLEAASFLGDDAKAAKFLGLYNASVAGLNARTQRITASSVPVIRVRAGMMP